jgi:fucose permease
MIIAILGFGIGLSLETNAGVFSISLAEGKRDDDKLNFQQSKIHIGFISLF